VFVRARLYCACGVRVSLVCVVCMVCVVCVCVRLFECVGWLWCVRVCACDVCVVCACV
jgi:hypothetical protein